MNNKRVVLITSYCDNQSKIDVLVKNIMKVKENNLDVFLMSPIELPKEVISLCDLYIQTKENPITKWPDKSMFEYRGFNIDDTFFEMNLGKPDYGWASLYQLKKICQIALTYDYEYYYHILYDTKLDDSLLKYFKTNEQCLLFPTSKGFSVGGYFMGFNKNTLGLCESLITTDLYYKNFDVAEQILVSISNVLPCKICEEITEDEIYYFEGLDLFNYSDFNNFKFFIHKRTGMEDNAKLFFYDMLSETDVIVRVNDFIINKRITNHTILDLTIDWSLIDSLSITNGDRTQDLSSRYSNITHNTMKINYKYI